MYNSNIEIKNYQVIGRHFYIRAGGGSLSIVEYFMSKDFYMVSLWRIRDSVIMSSVKPFFLKKSLISPRECFYSCFIVKKMHAIRMSFYLSSICLTIF